MSLLSIVYVCTTRMINRKNGIFPKGKLGWIPTQPHGNIPMGTYKEKIMTRYDVKEELTDIEFYGAIALFNEQFDNFEFSIDWKSSIGFYSSALGLCYDDNSVNNRIYFNADDTIWLSLIFVSDKHKLIVVCEDVNEDYYIFVPCSEQGFVEVKDVKVLADNKFVLQSKKY